MEIDQDTTTIENTDTEGLLGFDWFVNYNPSWIGWELYCQRVLKGLGQIQFAESLLMRTEPHSPGNQIHREPLIRLHHAAAQGLLDALWKSGLRPTAEPSRNIDDMQAHLDELRVAKDAHLADLQKVAFNDDTVSVPLALYERMCGMIETEHPVTTAVGFHTGTEEEEDDAGIVSEVVQKFPA